MEAAIQDNLYRLMEGKTVIAIAHRLSTIAALDRLIVLDEGRIVEEGTHEALIAKGGLYAQLFGSASRAASSAIGWRRSRRCRCVCPGNIPRLASATTDSACLDHEIAAEKAAALGRAAKRSSARLRP